MFLLFATWLHFFTPMGQTILLSLPRQTCSQTSPSQRSVMFAAFVTWVQLVASQAMVLHSSLLHTCVQRPAVALDEQLMLHLFDWQTCWHRLLSHLIEALTPSWATWLHLLPPTGQVMRHSPSIQFWVQASASQVISLAEVWVQVFTVCGQVWLLQFAVMHDWVHFLALQVIAPQVVCRHVCVQLSQGTTFNAIALAPNTSLLTSVVRAH